MTTAHQQALALAAKYLEQLQEADQTHVEVSAETLRALRSAPGPSLPSPRPGPAPVPTPAFRPASASSPENKETEMLRLRQQAMACQICPHLARTRRNVVFGVGDIYARLMFVGEAPGADEDAQGEPFVGRAGQLLTKMIEAMGLTRSKVYIGNILKCRPDMPSGSPGNRPPTETEIANCKPYILSQIDLIRPQVLVALGASAIRGLLGVDSPVSRLRGHWLEFRGIPVMPTYHPSYLLRKEGPSGLADKRKAWEDMLAVMERLDMPVTEKQRGYFLSAIKKTS